jgi:hypothetical protein
MANPRARRRDSRFGFRVDMIVRAMGHLKCGQRDTERMLFDPPVPFKEP